MTIENAIEKVGKILNGRLSTGTSIRKQHGTNETYFPEILPDAVAFVNNSKEVSDIASICNQEECPIVAWGTGTSLEGNALAKRGGISINMMNMNKILQVNSEDMDVVIQPGVTREDLNSFIKDKGLFFPVDPGANASLGGMAATRASGTNAVRYGTMKDNILALEAVMADGTVIRTGSRAKKSSAGYDLTRLLIGSEGTLGLITELTVKLHGIPEMIAGGICSFPSIEAACNAVIASIQYGIPVARIELLDAVQVRACNRYSGLSLPEETLLLLEFHGTENSVREQSEIFGEIAAEHTPHRFKWTTDPDERAQLWKARHDAFWAALAILPGGVSMSTDVCVPISRLAECVEETRHDIEKTGLIAPIVGHVGDGNFHTLPIAMPDDDATWARIKAFSERLSERAIAMGGTCTGEHGIGQGKVDYLRQEMGPAVDVMMAVKQALDPNDILNPSKLFSK